MFPRLRVGISGPKNEFYLVASVKTDKDAKHIPQDIDGVKIEVRIIGVVKA